MFQSGPEYKPRVHWFKIRKSGLYLGPEWYIVEKKSVRVIEICHTRRPTASVKPSCSSRKLFTTHVLFPPGGVTNRTVVGRGEKSLSSDLGPELRLGRDKEKGKSEDNTRDEPKKTYTCARSGYDSQRSKMSFDESSISQLECILSFITTCFYIYNSRGRKTRRASDRSMARV